MAEQVGRLGRARKRGGHTPSKISRANGYNKRLAARQRRRAEKADPENAPARVIRGWAD